MTPLRHLIGVGSGALLVLSIVGLATRDDDSAPVGPAVPGEATIADFAYTPEPISVAVGGTVTWTNLDNQAHTVTSNDGGPLSSGNIPSDGTYEGTFDTAGTFNYICALHPFMKGTVEVTG